MTMGGNNPRRGRGIFGLIGLALGFGFGGHAAAQDSRMASMTERERDMQERTGVKMGPFDIRPMFGVDAGYSDNVYSSNTNKRGDGWAELRGQVDVQSRFAAHEIGGRVYVDRLDYSKYTSESATTFGALLNGKLNASRDTTMTVEASYDRLAESRLALNSNRNADTRAKYDVLRGQVALQHQFTNWEVTFGANYRDYSYASVAVAGVRTAQKFRDFHVWEATADVIYGTRDPTRFILHGSAEWRHYDIGIGDPRFDPTRFVDRSAHGYRIEVGIRREISQLIQGTVRVGYLNYRYRDARIPDFNAFSYHADLVWNVTPLTSLTASAERRLDETVSPSSSGNLRDEFQVGVQHELRRNILLLADARYARVKLVGTTQRSNEFDAGLGARYFIGNNMWLTGELRHGQRRSGIAAIDFTTNTASMSFRFLF